MTRDEIRAIVDAKSGRRLRVTFSDGVTQYVGVAAVDMKVFYTAVRTAANQKGSGRDSRVSSRLSVIEYSCLGSGPRTA